MPKRILPLTDSKVRTAKPPKAGGALKLFDGGGLYLLVTPSGGKLWQLKYRHEGREKKVALGPYPDVGLADARKRRAEARSQIAAGLDPAEVKKAQKVAQHSAAADSFEVLARAWHAANVPRWADTHAKTTLARLERSAFPWLGSKPAAEVTLADLKPVLHRIEQRAPESARRMFVCFGMVFRYCVAVGRLDRSPLEGLKPRDVLTVTPIEHHLPAITDPKELGALLRAIGDFKGSFAVKCALQLAPLLFQRPGDLRSMEWEDIDFAREEWNIPVEKMKLSKVQKLKRKGERHCVPLCRQALELLRQLEPLTGSGRYVLPGQRTPSRPMSEAALTAALHRMGYKGEMSWHGFRATARTLLDEVLGFRPDLIEHQLAHAVRDALGRAYNRTSHLPERKKMMQKWGDYLDRLKVGAEVIPFGGRFVAP